MGKNSNGNGGEAILPENIILRGADLTEERLREELQKELEKDGKKYNYVHVFVVRKNGRRKNTLLEIRKGNVIWDFGYRRPLQLDGGIVSLEIGTI